MTDRVSVTVLVIIHAAEHERRLDVHERLEAMTAEQDLVGSAVMARDVIESYRQSHIMISGWRSLLEEAAESLARISAGRPFADGIVPLAQLASTLTAAAQAGLKVDHETLDLLSQELRTIVTSTRVPGIPRPDDTDWSF